MASTVRRSNQQSKVEESVQETVEGQSGTCTVGYRLTIRKQLAEYESAEVQVSLFTRCPEAEVDETFKNVSDWVTDKVGDEMERAFKEFAGEGTEVQGDPAY